MGVCVMVMVLYSVAIGTWYCSQIQYAFVAQCLRFQHSRFLLGLPHSTGTRNRGVGINQK